jgi:hypothetical protein
MPDDGARQPELFDPAEYAVGLIRQDACAFPIGRRGNPRPHLRRPRAARQAPSARILAAVAELAGDLARQHAETLLELREVRRRDREDREILAATLRAVVEIKRHLGLTELHAVPRHSRWRPLGRDE